ncbi:9477_t:CDS:1, partial [Racocetra persica]
PDAEEIKSSFGVWIYEFNSDEANELKNRFLKADETIDYVSIVEQKHPDHMYTSKLINTREIDQKLSEIVFGSKKADSV